MIGVRRTAAQIVLMWVVLLLLAGPASAHSFLAATEPVQGARLAAAPDDVALQFSEEVLAGAVQTSLRSADGGRVVTGPPAMESGGAVVRQPLPMLDPDVYVVAWQVTSAVDGHESAGELAFSVGIDESTSIPLVADATPDVDAFAAVTAWVFFVGLAIGCAGLLAPYLRDDASVERRISADHHWVRAGGSIALVAVVTRVGLESVPSSELTPTDVALPAAAVLLALTLALARTRLWVPTGLVAAAATAWSARSHVAAGYGVVGIALDVVHLLTAAFWAGGLVWMVMHLWRDRGASGHSWRGPVRRYARLAVWLVGAVSLTGLGQAVLVLPTWRALWSTSYGLVLVAKTALLCAALSAAAVARWRALPAVRPRLLRGATATESWIVAGVLGAAALLVTTAPPVPAAAVASLLGPPPITGPTARAMDLAGSLTIDVAAGEARLDVSVISPSGGVDGATVTLSASLPGGTTTEMHPRPCGPGCFTQELALPNGRTTLHIEANAPGWVGGATEVDLQWPPPASRPELFQSMMRTMRAVDQVTINETVSSGPIAEAGGGSRLSMTGEAFVDLMPWAGGGVVDVRQGDDDVFTFYLAGSRMYFEVVTDAEGRVRHQRMVNPGHEIEYDLDYPDTPSGGNR